MIVTNLDNSARIEGLHPAFKTLFDYVKSHDLLHTDCGRIVLDGDDLFINNVEIAGVAKEVQLLEMHRTYIDVHILLEGSETIGWRSLESLKNITKEYSDDDDCALSDDEPTSYTTLQAGDIVVVYPEDPHAPAIGSGVIRKLIAKVKL